MSNYTHKTLKKIYHQPPKKAQYSPHQWNTPTFGNTIQITPIDNTERQSIIGTFFYYACAVDPTIFPVINDIASAQAAPTGQIKEKLKVLLEYMHTYPKAKIRFHASKMILNIDSDAAYLILPGAKSRVAGYYHMSTTPDPTTTSTQERNGAIHVECKALRRVVSSTAEAKTTAIFHNAKTAIEIRHTLETLGRPQPPTPLKTKNSTSLGFVKNLVNLKSNKSWDMRFHWLQEKKTKKTYK